MVALDLGRSKLALFLFLLRFESIFMGEKNPTHFSLKLNMVVINLHFLLRFNMLADIS